MFKQTKTTLKELSAQYRSVLKKCAYLNAIAIAGMAFGANADVISVSTSAELKNAIANLSAREIVLQNDLKQMAAGMMTKNNPFKQEEIILNGMGHKISGLGGYGFTLGNAETQQKITFRNILLTGLTSSNPLLAAFDGAQGKTITLDQVNIESNKTTNSSNAALIQLDVATLNNEIVIQNNSYFSSNKSSHIGVLGSFGKATIVDSFFNNNSNTMALEGNNAGAIFLGAESDTQIKNTEFNKNNSLSSAGAIGTRLAKDADNSAAKLDIEATFVGNKAATNGGAIYNTFYANNGLGKGDGVTIKGEFTRNTAGQNGGAIFNDGATDKAGNPGGVMTINDSTFEGNTVTVGDYIKATYKKEGVGGAIASSGILTINNSTFTGNTALSTGTGYGLGGALSTVTVDGLTTTMNVKNSTFSGNKATVGGAIYGMLYETHKQDYSTITIDNSVFNNNEARYTGSAIANYDRMAITGSEFSENKVLENVAGETDGGTLFLGSDSKTSVDGSLFVNNNSATVGGAIATRVAVNSNNTTNDNSLARLTINKVTFIGNTAQTEGGAIYNTFYNDMNGVGKGIVIADSTFTDNTAGIKGGAIYNDGKADSKGNFGVITLAGTNTFSNNTADGKLNDIYNDGILNISGDLTLDGGIAGNGTIEFTGDTNLITRLQKDSAVISGKTVSGLENVKIAGLVIENGLADAEYALVDATDAIGKQFGGITVTNTLYNFDLKNVANGSILVSRKSVAEQTAGLEKAGLDSNAAKTVAAMSALKTTGNAAADALFADLTAAAQLGDAEAAETINEVAKVINPESEAVVQSAAVSTQNTINTLTAGRMDLGRNGGDFGLTSGGVWVQGLFNRAKSGDKFSANTRGISAGIDGTINNDVMLGIGYAYGHSDVSAKTRDTDIDNHSVFLYGQYKPTQWYANATLNYTTSGYKENGTVAGLLAVDSEYRANAFGANVATGYELPFGLIPELGLRYLHVRTNDYTNSLGFHTDAKNTNFLTGIIGARYGFDISSSGAWLIRPELSAAAKYDLVSDGNTATVALPGVDAYTLDVERLNRFGGEFGAGLTMSYYGFDLSLTYYIDVREDYTSQTGMAKFRYNF